MAWGENDCLGLENLNQVVCRLQLKPSDLDGVQCIPDGSNGACHLEKPKCPKDDKVYVCATDTYNQQKLQKSQILKAWGYGACEARWELGVRACQANLNPKLVGKVSCEQDLVTSECIKGIESCFDKIATTTCRGVLKKSEQAVEATSDSECAAKAVLSLQSCVLGESPASLNDVVCRSL